MHTHTHTHTREYIYIYIYIICLINKTYRNRFVRDLILERCCMWQSIFKDQITIQLSLCPKYYLRQNPSWISRNNRCISASSITRWHFPITITESHAFPFLLRLIVKQKHSFWNIQERLFLCYTTHMFSTNAHGLNSDLFMRFRFVSSAKLQLIKADDN